MTGDVHRIILADNQGVFRAGAARILAMENDFRVVAQCLNTDHLDSVLATTSTMIVIFGSSLQLNLTDLVARLAPSRSRAIAVLEHGQRIDPFVDAQIEGVIFRSITGAGLVECVRRVASGFRVMPPIIRKSLACEEDIAGARMRDRLTPKEIKIVALIVQGCKNKEIAMQLDTTEQVIKNYLRSIYDKTGMSARLELALYTVHHPALAAAAEFASIQIKLGRSAQVSGAAVEAAE